MSVLQLRNVSVTIGGARLVDDVTVDVAPGEWLGVIGPNGAGKTTLLRAVAGAIDYSGSISVDGDDLSRMRTRARARQLAYAPQEPILPPDMTVRGYVALGRTPHIGYLGAETTGDLDIVDETLPRLDLTDLAGHDLGTLSGGERRRAVVAQALTQQAPILLLDEPTAALDIGHQQEVLELVDRLRREDGLTVITSLHDLTLAAQYPDRLLLLAGGAVAATGTPAELLTADSVSLHYGAAVHVLEVDGDLLIHLKRNSSSTG